MKKKTILILIIAILTITIVNAIENVSVSQNLLKITAPNYTQCQGNVCSYEFLVENLDSVNRRVNISNIFYSDVEIMKLERYQNKTINQTINNPYACSCYQDVINGTLTNMCSLCDNFTTQTTNKLDFFEVPSQKYDDNVKSSESQTILVHKNSENLFRIIFKQPLGRVVKSDVSIDTEDALKIILDPYSSSTEYYINLTGFYASNYSYQYILEDTRVSSTPSSGATDTQIYIEQNSPKSRIYFLVQNLTGYSAVNFSYYIYGMDGFLNNVEFYYCSAYFNETNLTWANQDIVVTGCDYSPFKSFSNLNISSGWVNLTLPSNATSDSDGLFTIKVKFDAENGTAHWVGFNSSESTAKPNITYYKLLNVFVNNSLNKNENLTINTSLTGVRVNFDSSVVSQLNDSALGDNLVSGTCYNLLQTSLNWTMIVNLNYSLDLSRVVNYSFTTCSGGGGGSIDLFSTTIKKTNTNVLEAIKKFLNNPTNQNLNNIFITFDNAIRNLFTTGDINTQPIRTTSKTDVQAASDKFLTDFTFTHFIEWFKVWTNYLFKTNTGNMQVVQ